MKGWIYISVNSLADEVIKVDSCSGDPDVHLKKGSSASGMPGANTIQYACWVDDYKSVEKEVNEELQNVGVDDSPNWFHFDVPNAIGVIRSIIIPIFEEIKVPDIPSIAKEKELERVREIEADRDKWQAACRRERKGREEAESEVRRFREEQEQRRHLKGRPRF